MTFPTLFLTWSERSERSVRATNKTRSLLVDLASWEGDHTRSQKVGLKLSEKCMESNETWDFRVLSRYAQLEGQEFLIAPSGEKFI